MVDCYENINNKYMRSIDRRVFKWKKMTRELLVSANLPFVTYRLYIMRVVWTVKQTKRRHLSWKVVVFFFFCVRIKMDMHRHLCCEMNFQTPPQYFVECRRFHSKNDQPLLNERQIFHSHERSRFFFYLYGFFFNSCSLF